MLGTKNAGNYTSPLLHILLSGECMNKLLTVTISALFLVLLISSVSFVSSASSLPPMLEYFNEQHNNTMTTANINWVNRDGYNYGYMISGNLSLYGASNPVTQYIISNKELNLVYENGYDRLKSLDGTEASLYSIYKSDSGTFTTGSSVITPPLGNIAIPQNSIIKTSYNSLPYSNGSSNVIMSEFIKPTDEIELPNEYLYITSPREGYKTIDKFIKYTINYSIAADSVNDLVISIKNENGQTLDLDTKIDVYNIVRQTNTQEGIYQHGQLDLLVEYSNTWVGDVGISVQIKNNVTNRALSIIRHCELVAFTDANGDGIDDNTGQDQYIRPDFDGLDDMDLTLDGSINILKDLMPNLNAALATIVGLMAVLFSWLPSELSGLIFVIIILIAITTLVKILRG